MRVSPAGPDPAAANPRRGSFEIVDDGNRAAFAHQHRRAAERGFERAQRRLCLARSWARPDTPPRRDRPRSPAARRRTDFSDMAADEFANFCRSLVRHEAAGDFRPRPRRHNRLAAFTLVAARQAIDLNVGRALRCSVGVKPRSPNNFFTPSSFWRSRSLMGRRANCFRS